MLRDSLGAVGMLRRFFTYLLDKIRTELISSVHFTREVLRFIFHITFVSHIGPEKRTLCGQIDQKADALYGKRSKNGQFLSSCHRLQFFALYIYSLFN